MTEFRKSKVLIVEDEPDVAELYRMAFEAAGFEVATINEAATIQMTARNFDPDCILLDIMLPYISGLEALALINKEKEKNPEFARWKVIMLTNLSGDEQIKTAAQNGATGYFVKADVSPKALVTYVKQVIAS